VSRNRRQHHHVVPRLHLRGFATPEGRIAMLDLDTGRRREVGIADAAVISNFYTVVLPDVTRTDAWEQWLSEAENAIAPALRRAITMPRFQLTEDDREVLARWIALQFLRGPDNRAQMAAASSITTRMQVGMGGLAYLRHAMSQGLDREVAQQEAEEVWDDITGADGPDMVISGDEHLTILAGAYDTASAMVHQRTWGRIRFQRHRLAVSDAPVHLVPGADPFRSSGLAGAEAITVPLDRHTLLWLELPVDHQPHPDRDLQPSAVMARAHNHVAMLGAERFLYFHPDDDPVTPEVPLPRARPQRLAVQGDLNFANRDRPLSEVLAQNAQHAADTDRDRGTLIADYTWPIPGYRPRART
jgi:hypothetical protein